jgi:cytochrome P450
MAFFPFSGGPRRCIGEGFALLQLPLVVAMVAQRFRLTLLPARPRSWPPSPSAPAPPC